MKYLTSIILLTIILICNSAFTFSSKNCFTDNKKNIEVIFNHKLTFNDVVKLKLDLAEKGLSLVYKKLEFDENSKLISISFLVNCNDGYKGSDEANNLNDESRVGFYRNYSEKGKPDFVCGVIKP